MKNMCFLMFFSKSRGGGGSPLLGLGGGAPLRPPPISASEKENDGFSGFSGFYLILILWLSIEDIYIHGRYMLQAKFLKRLGKTIAVLENITEGCGIIQS